MSIIRHLTGEDPSDTLYQGLGRAMPDVTFRWDMTGSVEGTVCHMVLEPGQYPTPVTQTVMLRLSVYKLNADGTGDWKTASVTMARIHRWLRGHATDYPLCDVTVQSGPIRTVDDRLRVEFAYSVAALTVAAR